MFILNSKACRLSSKNYRFGGKFLLEGSYSLKIFNTSEANSCIPVKGR